MADPKYYNTLADGTSTSYNADVTSSSSTQEIYYTQGSSSCTPRRVLVKVPNSWNGKTIDKWINLINKKTSTGWKITLLISGEITIVDPRIEKRSMSEFLPLLKMRALDRDIYLIDKFIKTYGVD